MKKIKNLKTILIIVAFALLIIFLSLLIIKIRNNKTHSEEKNLESYAPGAPMAQVYSAALNPVLKNDDMTLGSGKAKVIIFVYEDASNIYSAKLADTLERIYSEHKNDVAIVIRPFLTNKSSFSRDAALAIECAGDQNKWQEMRALLFSQVKNESLNLTDLTPYIDQLSLDKDTFSICLTNKDKSEKIEKLSSEASSYSVLGAPTMFINNEIVLGARPYDDYTDSNGDKIEGLNNLVLRKLQ